MRGDAVERFEHVLDAGVDGLGELADGGGAPELCGQRFGGRVEAQRALLDVAGNPNRPAVVAEVAFELAEDGGDGEAGEGGSARCVEALDRLQQPERGYLVQVVEIGSSAIAAGEVTGERQVASEHGIPAAGIAASAIAGEQSDVAGVRWG